MDLPRLLAVNHVNLTAASGSREAVQRFYADLLGFEPVPDESDGYLLVFRGQPRSGPRLMVRLTPDLPDKPMRRQALVQVKALTPYAELLSDHRIAFEWSSGWFYFDRRIGVLDPGGNWIELVCSHAL